ncbi:YceI family protein [Tenacibaculum sp. 190524A05c]|uniref:YceI family protein n=1 Tax=Tenacibaculum platacis TaxID=3137852 RepID=UPI0031FB1E71
MKKIIVLTLLVISQITSAQKYFTRTGATEFKASVAAFEPVEASNKSTTVILKSDTGDIAAQLFINAFQFRVALMQEHFNENYMDSDTYPKATFRGKIQNFSLANIDSEKKYPLKGMLTIRGKQKEINTTVSIQLKGDTIILKSEFKLNPNDFGIKIPSIVRKKIAKQINITLQYELVEKK